MRRIISCMLIAALAASSIPAGALADSVFDVSRVRLPQLRLEGDTHAALSGAGGAFGLDGSLSPGESGSTISAVKAGSSSMLLPGLGEQRLGHTLRAKVFFGLEAVGWISVATFLWRGHSRENSYKEYAIAFAEVSGTGHTDDYYKTIGQYMASDGPGGYNESVRRDARDLYYPDLDAMESYYRSHAISGDESWNWRSEDTYRRYGVLRDGSRFSNRVALYSAIGLAALRIASAADAVRLARLDRGRAADKGTTSMGLEPAHGGFTLFVQRSF